MSVFIPEIYIDEVRRATDIVELVEDYVQLKRRGSNFTGLCPFHNEKTPSFNVNPGMGIFKCFGCGVGGDAFQFLIRIEQVTFPESVRLLAERAGIELPESEHESQNQSETESISQALRFAGRFFYQSLVKTAEGKDALEYVRRRGYTDATLKKYGLGYAPAGWDALLRAAEKKHIAPETLESAGLVIPRRGRSGHYDRYRDRIIFPIFSHIGKVIGFGGRILKPEEDQPKYINSPETRVYQKSRVLYGLYQGKQAIRDRDEALLVEGYTDVLSLHQAGVEQAVATSGTALTTDQIKLLQRYTKRIVMLYDADAAGVKAALKGIELVLAQGGTVYGLELPEGEDPDSFIRTEGGPAFEAFMRQHRKDFIEFMHDIALRSGQLNTPEGQAQLTRDMVRMVAIMPDRTMHEPFIRRISHVLDVPDIPLHKTLQELIHEVRSHEKKHRPPKTPAEPVDAGHYAPDDRRRSSQERSANPPGDGDAGRNAPLDEKGGDRSDPQSAPGVAARGDPLPQEKMLLRLMLDHGAPLIEHIMGNMALSEFTPGVMVDTIHHLLLLYEEGKVDRQPFIDGALGPDAQSLVAEVLMIQHEPSENWERKQKITVPRFNEAPHVSAVSAMKQLKRRRVGEALRDLKKRIFLAQRHGEDVKPLLEERMALLEFQKQIEAPDFLLQR